MHAADVGYGENGGCGAASKLNVLSLSLSNLTNAAVAILLRSVFFFV